MPAAASTTRSYSAISANRNGHRPGRACRNHASLVLGLLALIVPTPHRVPISDEGTDPAFVTRYCVNVAKLTLLRLVHQPSLKPPLAYVSFLLQGKGLPSARPPL